MRAALIVVDVQRDFCKGGALEAVDTASLLDPLQAFVCTARELGMVVAFTQDWHPANHQSFRINGGAWPAHCIAGSIGAELSFQPGAHPDDVLIHKGTTPWDDGYSAFHTTELADLLLGRAVLAVGVCGIATEYCVRATAGDAARCGFETFVLTDLVRPVNVLAGLAALEELESAGIQAVPSRTWATRMLSNNRIT